MLGKKDKDAHEPSDLAPPQRTPDSPPPQRTPDSPTSPSTTSGPKFLLVAAVPQAGFNRGGRYFTREPELVDTSALTPEQVQSIIAEPKLVVKQLSEHPGSRLSSLQTELRIMMSGVEKAVTSETTAGEGSAAGGSATSAGGSPRGGGRPS